MRRDRATTGPRNRSLGIRSSQELLLDIGEAGERETQIEPSAEKSLGCQNLAQVAPSRLWVHKTLACDLAAAVRHPNRKSSLGEKWRSVNQPWRNTGGQASLPRQAETTGPGPGTSSSWPSLELDMRNLSQSSYSKHRMVEHHCYVIKSDGLCGPNLPSSGICHLRSGLNW